METTELQRLLSRHGTFTVVGKLGRGAYGEVFRVRRDGHGGFSKDVAIKVAVPEAAESDELCQRFRSEASLSGTLRHDNIVQVTNLYDLGERMAIEFELVEGLTLSEAASIADKHQVRIPPAFAIHIAIEVLDALEFLRTASHQGSAATGIVHRDIKPSNIFVNLSGVTKVGDFGIAHLPDSQQTRAGSFIGTLRYLPFEAFGDGQAHHSWDVWACSVVLWELLTQRCLITNERFPDGQAVYQVMRALQNLDVPDPSAIMSDVPLSLSRIVVKALQVSTEARYATAGEMRSALLNVAQAKPSGRDVARKVVANLIALQDGAKSRVKALSPLRSALINRALEVPRFPPTSPSAAMSVDYSRPPASGIPKTPSEPSGIAREIYERPPDASVDRVSAPPMPSRTERPLPSPVQNVSAMRNPRASGEGIGPETLRPNDPVPEKQPGWMSPGSRRSTWVVTLIMILFGVAFWAFGPDKDFFSEKPAELTSPQNPQAEDQ